MRAIPPGLLWNCLNLGVLIFCRATGMEIIYWFLSLKILQPHQSSLSGTSGSSSVLPSPPQQPRPQHRDEITSLETFRAILERGSQDDASLKHQTSHMSEESEEEILWYKRAASMIHACTDIKFFLLIIKFLCGNREKYYANYWSRLRAVGCNRSTCCENVVVSGGIFCGWMGPGILILAIIYTKHQKSRERIGTKNVWSLERLGTRASWRYYNAQGRSRHAMVRYAIWGSSCDCRLPSWTR